MAYVDAAFNRMDLNGDGFISLDELLSELPQDSLVGSPTSTTSSADGGESERVAEARRMLREADENGALHLQLQQRLAGFAAPGRVEGAQAVGALAVGARTFSHMCDHQRLPPIEPIAHQSLTITGDGRISREEFHNLLRHNVAPDSLSMYDDRLSRPAAAAA